MFKTNPLDSVYVTSPYGPRFVEGTGPFHMGIDLRGSFGTPYKAVDEGIVKVYKVDGAGLHKGYGIYCVVEHNGYCTLGAHLDKVFIKSGTKVKPGQVLGYLGNTGLIYGPHLHFEVIMGKYDGNFFKNLPNGNKYNRVDPEPFLLSDYVKILHEKTNSPEKWIAFIEEMKGHNTGKFLPQLIETLGGK